MCEHIFSQNKIPADTSLTKLLGISLNDAAAIIGCGGKTSLLYRLAAENRTASTLIGTTARMFPPPAGIFDYEAILCPDEAAKPGVTLISGGESGGKLLPPPKETLSRVSSRFDYTFLECDGSNLLPLKGWADHEPVIPDFATITIGVAVVRPIGQILSDRNAHRLSLFCKISDAKPGDIIEARHIAAMLSHPSGMLRNAVGRKALFFNQIEDEDSLLQVREIMRLLPDSFISGLSRVISGSLHHNIFTTLWEA